MKRLFTFLLFFIGGSALLFIATLSGCNRTTYLVAYKDVHFDVRTVDTVNWPVPVLSGDSVSYANLDLGIRFENHILDQAAVLFPGTNLYAYKKDAANRFRSIEKIQDIRIITIQDYSARFPAGAELSEYCSYFSYSDSNSMSKSEMILWLNRTRSEYSEHNQFGGMELNIESPPDLAGYQQFAIEVLTENQVILRDTTALFFLYH